MHKPELMPKTKLKKKPSVDKLANY